LTDKTSKTTISSPPLHDALPIYIRESGSVGSQAGGEKKAEGSAQQDTQNESRQVCAVAASRDEYMKHHRINKDAWKSHDQDAERSEEHTSELQSRVDIVCRRRLE